MADEDAARRAVIIGAGAIGVGIGAWLERAGWAPGFVGRGGPAAVDRPLSWADGTTTRFCRPAGGGDLWRRADAVFVAVKAFDLAAALAAVGDVPAGTPVIPLANGAVEELVTAAAARRPALAWRLGFCTFGVSREAGQGGAPDGLALRSRRGQAHWGPLAVGGAPTAAEQALVTAPQARLPAAVGGGGGPPFFCWHDDVRPAQRRKWLYNVVMNSLTAARRLPSNAGLHGDAPMLAAVFGEAMRLGAGRWGPWSLGRDALYAGLLDLIESTKTNENSMALDRRLGRRTESDYLAGQASDPDRYPLLTSLHREIVGA